MESQINFANAITIGNAIFFCLVIIAIGIRSFSLSRKANISKGWQQGYFLIAGFCGVAITIIVLMAWLGIVGFANSKWG